MVSAAKERHFIVAVMCSFRGGGGSSDKCEDKYDAAASNKGSLLRAGCPPHKCGQREPHTAFELGGGQYSKTV